MEDFFHFIIWSLAIFSAANGIVISDLLAPTRNFIARKSSFFGNLVHCPLCLGFWLGLGAHFFMFSPTNFWLGDAFLGSGMSWLIYIGIYRRQFNLEGGQGCSNCGQKNTPEQQLLNEDMTRGEYQDILREVRQDDS
jgi:hypothetical protein